MLHDIINKSKVGGDQYKCSVCNQILKSRAAIIYHVKHRHILKELSNETMWVSQRVKEGRQEKSEGGVVTFEWRCHMCENIVYPSHQGLRAHIKSHYSKLFKIDGDNNQEFIDMITSSMGIVDESPGENLLIVQNLT